MQYQAGKLIAVVALAVAMATAPVVKAAEARAGNAGTPDTERVVNLKKLTEALADATGPIRQRMSSTNLKERFQAVNAMLEAPEVDKRDLVAALRGLDSELGRFLENFDQDCIRPFWEAQDSVAATVENVRAMLARCKTGKPDEETKKKLEAYDDRLRNLARAVKQEKNETRQRQLKQMFANSLSLRDLVEKYGSLSLNKAHEAVYAKTLQALQALEMQFTAATFRLEQIRVILDAERSFVQQATGLLEGVIEAEVLADVLANMGDAGEGLGKVLRDVGDMSKDADIFRDGLMGLMGRVADGIQAETDKIQAGVAPEYADDEALEDKINHYAK